MLFENRQHIRATTGSTAAKVPRMTAVCNAWRTVPEITITMIHMKIPAPIASNMNLAMREGKGARVREEGGGERVQ